MGKSIIFKSDINDDGYSLEVFETKENTVRIYISSEDEPCSAYMDFSKESAKEFIKEMNKQIKKID